MRHWYIVNNYGQYEGKDKTFEGAFYKVMSRIENQPLTELYIINEEQYSDLCFDGWCEGGLRLSRNEQEEMFEIETYEHWLDEEIKAYKRSGQ